MFSLNERLQADTRLVTDLRLCRVLLMNNRLWPWLILVPMREDAVEIHRLGEADQLTLMREIALASRVVERLFAPDKMNVGALGNMVPQLHVHVIGRTRGDPAWPGPVWGSGHAEPYEPAEAAALVDQLAEALRANE
ncbi:diadenosine tetraphosphate (Ap4A) HIT family hydrolase [Azospirillum lipoferum]|uniref:HIT family protein n=1 Tax=Azospirillum lipoferum TaxID=193 RepID=A0A5A9FZA5_AZOLI|nr:MULTISPECIES: HIT family protein [Azospirillum]KAA0587580.1 HIT family protein [Azospirillum lipoferum]MCP1608862.1 diadenosine tetraphosphate (Ap4A) HIT family hydrolase [Azospirillum lipoferum]MDW5535823.1 HIT family protein [Azospirillum sp. NL1]